MRLKEYLEYQLEVHRARNDGDLDPIATARTRGRIAAYKELLELDAPAISDTDV